MFGVRGHSTGIPQNSRLSWMLLPTNKTGKGDSKSSSSSISSNDTTDMLTKAGYIHQSSAGIFTLMPMAQRVVDKIERIVDEEMGRVGGQKLAMPTLLTQSSWLKTGRWESTGEELFSLTDRRGSTLILGPTHEEEITELVRSTVTSHRRYPLRLYQTTRKFRDETRPRAGLLRGREFIMKDMYSFDVTKEKAIETFWTLEAAYRKFFDRIGVPYVVADADSGNIGGTLSKEFHFVNGSGEDTLLECTNCGYTANEERAQGVPTSKQPLADVYCVMVQNAAKETLSARAVVVPKDHKPSMLKISKEILTGPKQSLVLASIGSGINGVGEALDVAAKWQGSLRNPLLLDRSVTLVDSCLRDPGAQTQCAMHDAELQHRGLDETASWGDWHVAQSGDACSRCRSGVLQAQRSIEVGHIFYLGDKYSRAMELSVLYENKQTSVQMGCYGIGISRILQAVAECCQTGKRGLRWPLSIAPYAAAVLPLVGADRVSEVYALLSEIGVGGYRPFSDNIAVDDRDHLRPGFRLNDVELLGFPVTVVLGKRFSTAEEVEVQLRIPHLRLATVELVDGIRVSGDDHDCRAYVKLDKLSAFLTTVLQSLADSLAVPVPK
ncbi:hypothetical protein H4217_001912 [Coemansia sp. RSA 1939]|nr:hypothetical protein H4217_001912 [Coemansia sp. RSA 1939]KAJ2615610.1 hypothetical protein EV177_001491 [Coemansia sp. RSA 1804]